MTWNRATRLKPHYVYRAYRDDDVLLYVGCTVDVHTRLMTHQREGKTWTLDTAYVTWEQFPDSDTGRAAEQAVIQAERPLYNIRNARFQPRTSRVFPIRPHVAPVPA